MKDYLGRFLTKQEENAGALKNGNRQNRQKAVRPADEKSGRAYKPEPTKPTKGGQTVEKVAFVGFVGDHSQERADFFSSTPAERPRLGSFARPMVCRGDRMPDDCLWATCNGSLSDHGHNRYLCSNCGTWFELLPTDFGVYVGDLGDDFDAGDVAEGVM